MTQFYETSNISFEIIHQTYNYFENSKINAFSVWACAEIDGILSTLTHLWSCITASMNTGWGGYVCFLRASCEPATEKWEAEAVYYITCGNGKVRQCLFDIPSVDLAYWHTLSCFSIFSVCYHFSLWGSCCQFLPRLIIAFLASPRNGPMLSNLQHRACSACD